ncbi:MAG: hypothetical protein JO030_04090, partial [Candidatus Eremiobacteraeota bacterium]|nr:hypothetical protein [Candidatus Eremiobacteraeota bacterium]
AHIAGSVVPLASRPPVLMQFEWLMTDGSVLAQPAAKTNEFYRYAPDAYGDYSKGTWSRVGTLPKGYAPTDFASAVLADGRFVISGGEYNKGSKYQLALTNRGAIYDPVKMTWTSIGHPAGWNWIGDSPATVLADGRFLVGDKLHRWDAYLDPKTLQWSQLSNAGKEDENAEEGWTLLSDGTVLTADVRHAPHSERYDPKAQQWRSAGSTVVVLHSPRLTKGCLRYGPAPKDCYYPAGEIGPAILRPDGTVFYTGSFSTKGNRAGHTAIYYSTGAKAGTWAAGPDFPNGDNAGDSFAALEPSGNVLVYGVSGATYEWNGAEFTQIPDLRGVGSPLLLPTGQIMLIAATAIVLYTPTGSADPRWVPTISRVPRSITAGKTYEIEGTQFNGLSQASSFGDEYQNATNYPLVRITNKKTHHVYYARTHDHSTMGVATGRKRVWTYFDVPKGIEAGASTVEVVANGISSNPVAITVR